MSLDEVARHVRAQADGCRRLGSPFYAVLLGQVADDVVASGPCSDVLGAFPGNPDASALALRLAGTVHRLVLAGEAPELAAHYPSCGGDGDAGAAWPAFRALVRDRHDDVRAGMRSAPQTNEVGRSAPLFGALLQVLGGLPRPMPVRVWEIGASAGLNLRADAFGYQALDGGGWGPADGPVVLPGAWTSVPVDAPHRVDVVERVGGDVAPVDPASTDGALRLASYVWPDQLERLARLRGAIEVARAVPVRMVTAGAADLLAGLSPAEGRITLVWHSVMWQYLASAEQRVVAERLSALGATADAGAPVVHITFEPNRTMFEKSARYEVMVRTWPGGQERVLGDAPAHGMPVTWRG